MTTRLACMFVCDTRHPKGQFTPDSRPATVEWSRRCKCMLAITRQRKSVEDKNVPARLAVYDFF